MKNLTSININQLRLSIKTINALEKNGFHTLQDLLIASDCDLLAMHGLGETAINEIRTVCQEYNGQLSLFTEENKQIITFGECLNLLMLDWRKKDIIIEFYNEQPNITLQKLGDKYGITRERVRQIIVKITKRIQKKYNERVIDKDYLSELEKAADRKTEIHLINIKDPFFSSSGIAFLAAAIDPKTFKVYKSSAINGEWFVKKEDNVNIIISSLLDELRHNSNPLQISRIKNLYSINEDMLMSIKKIIEKDGYVTLKSNRIASGRDRNAIITSYLEKIHRPVTITEIVNNTSLAINQVRGALADKRKYVNVGKSTYDLSNEYYEDLEIDELAVNILTAENRALEIKKAVEYVQKYKKENKTNILIQLINSRKLRKKDNYLLLKEWTDDRIIQYERKNYSVNLEDAIFEVINSSNEVFNGEKAHEIVKNKYGDRVSNNINSTKAALLRLSDKNLITRIAPGCYVKRADLPTNAANKTASTITSEMTLSKFVNAHIGKYMEIRYKTDRKDSEYRWRKISVSGQDKQNIYTYDLDINCRPIHYIKEKVVEYREAQNDKITQTPYLDQSQSPWIEDVLKIVKQIPKEEFGLEDIYSFKEQLSKIHPSNNNIEAKIRQQLQYLRDNGTIRFLGNGRYKKLI